MSIHYLHIITSLHQISHQRLPAVRCDQSSVNGGSEFRDEFEQACEALNLPLFTLPPKKPEWNGCVERANAVVMSSTRGMKGR